MPFCFILPGFGGSELKTHDTGSLIWPNRKILYFGGLSYMEMSADNGGPKLPVGLWLVPGKSADGYMDQLSLSIGNQTSFSPYTWGWDWRSSFKGEGIKLAEYIMQIGGPTTKHAIVAHSAGGLVARYCWGYLRSKGKENLLGRIITLGTPHRGTLAGRVECIPCIRHGDI